MDIKNLQRWDHYFDEHPEYRTIFFNKFRFFTFLKTYRAELLELNCVVKTRYGIFVESENMPKHFIGLITKDGGLV